MPILNSRAQGKTQTGDIIPAPEFLTRFGPVIKIMLTLPDDARCAYVDRGEQSPEAVNGFAMIDTGASTTCFDTNAAQSAKLPTVGVAQMISASHANNQVPKFAGKIVCPTITINVEEGMGANLSSIDDNLIALLGRDILEIAILTYNGPDGHVSLAI